MRKSILKTVKTAKPTIKAEIKPKVEVKLEKKPEVNKILPKEDRSIKGRFFGKRPWSELSIIEKRMLDLYGNKYDGNYVTSGKNKKK